jgi:hypothetical protein
LDDHNNYEIKPYIGVGHIDLGIRPDEIHEILGVPETNDENANTIFEFYRQNSRFSIQYDIETKKCVAIAMMSPANPVYLGRHPMNESWRTASKWLRKIDSNIEEIDVGVIGHDTGIHLAHAKVMLPCNNVMRNVDVVNVVIVFARGYWDRPVTDLPIDEEKLARFDNAEDPYDWSLYI